MGVVTSEDRPFLLREQDSPGQYIGPIAAVASSVTPGSDEERLCPYWIPQTALYDRIMCEVLVAGEAGSLIRLGIRLADSETGDPWFGPPLLDAGTVPGDGATGLKEVTISQQLQRGLVWLSSAYQLAATTRPNMRSLSCPSSWIPHGANSGGDCFANGQWVQTGVSGALGAWASNWSSTLGQAPKLWLKRAA